MHHTRYDTLPNQLDNIHLQSLNLCKLQTSVLHVLPNNIRAIPENSTSLGKPMVQSRKFLITFGDGSIFKLFGYLMYLFSLKIWRSRGRGLFQNGPKNLNPS